MVSIDEGKEARHLWQYPSQWGEEKLVLGQVRAILNDCGIPPERIEDMVSALAEACLNAAEHGNGMDARRLVTVELEQCEGGTRFRVYDDGPGADEQRLRRRNTLADSSGDRGWGILIMTELADDLRFYRGERGFCTELCFVSRRGNNNDES